MNWTGSLLFALLATTLLVSGCITIIFEDSSDGNDEPTPQEPASQQNGQQDGDLDGSDLDPSRQTAPTLGMTTASGTSSDRWSIRITAATQALPISEYTLVLTAPSGTYSSRLDSWNQGGYSVGLAMGGNTLSVGERIQINGFFQGGLYTAELVHMPTGSSAGSISRSF